MRAYSRHHEDSVLVASSPERVFAYADDHRQLSSHMNQSSWMMAGGAMTTEVDELEGKVVGSHIHMSGKVMGLTLKLDEVVTQREPPHRKAWETAGPVHLLVISDYRMGFVVTPDDVGSRLTVFIDYDLPSKGFGRVLGVLLGKQYAQWCVKQMSDGVRVACGNATSNRPATGKTE
jgi:uncharacterized protein YndB with AHSA1/START domain